MIFQSKNTKGKISQTNRLKNQPIYSSSDLNLKKNSTSFRFFLYFIILFFGIIVGFFLFQYSSIGNINISDVLFKKNSEKNLNLKKEKEKFNEKTKEINKIKSVNADLVIAQKDFQKVIVERIRGLEERIDRFDEVSKNFLIELNSTTRKNEEKIDSDLVSMNFKINEANKNINNIITMFDRLRDLELLIDKKIKYFSISISLYNLKESIKNNYDINFAFKNLQKNLESFNDQIYSNQLLELADLFKDGIKNREELIYLFNDLEKKILLQNNIINNNNIKGPVNYFSSLVTIRKLKKSESQGIEDIFKNAKVLLYQNKLKEAIVELEKISEIKNRDLNNWIIQCKKFIEVERLLALIGRTAFKYEDID